VLAAEPAAQQRVVGDSVTVRVLQAARAAMLHALRSQATAAPILSDSAALLDYLMLDQGHAPVERLRVLYLNGQNALLGETVTDGTVNEAAFYPREILKRALELGATALILVHNHPSGDLSPSQSDLQITRAIAGVGRTLRVVVHDHLILSRHGWTSFKALGLL
jgi:DNA repair protein RadC